MKALASGAAGKDTGEEQKATLGNGVAALIGINILFYILDHVLGVRAMKLLYLPLDGAHLYQYVTSMFCHGSWLHLSGNLVFLYLFGKIIEEQEGTLGVVVSYLVCGLGGNLLSEIFLSGGYALGASGAVFGLFAVGALIKLRMSWRSIVEALILGQFMVLQLVNEATRLGASDGIGHLTHIGGAVTGGVLIFVVARFLRAPARS